MLLNQNCPHKHTVTGTYEKGPLCIVNNRHTFQRFYVLKNANTQVLTPLNVKARHTCNILQWLQRSLVENKAVSEMYDQSEPTEVKMSWN